MAPVLCFSGGYVGVVLTFPCSPETVFEGWERKKVRESTFGRANLHFMCCSLLLYLTAGCSSNGEECEAVIGPPTLVQCFGLSWRLTCCTLLTAGQCETANKGLWPWEVPSAYITTDLCFPALLRALQGGKKDLKEMLLPGRKKKTIPKMSGRNPPDQRVTVLLNGQKWSKQILTKPYKSVFSFPGDILDGSWILMYPVEL